MVIIWLMMVHINLVGGWALPLWKMMEWKSVGMIYYSQLNGKIKVMFRTTNQCLSRSRTGSEYNVQWFYLVGGEIILTSTFLF